MFVADAEFLFGAEHAAVVDTAQAAAFKGHFDLTFFVAVVECCTF